MIAFPQSPYAFTSPVCFSMIASLPSITFRRAPLFFLNLVDLLKQLVCASLIGADGCDGNLKLGNALRLFFDLGELGFYRAQLGPHLAKQHKRHVFRFIGHVVIMPFRMGVSSTHPAGILPGP
jgi:hypothetical protein